MTMVLDAQATRPVATLPASARPGADADTLEDIIAAHREALLALAPRQEERSARVEAGWHIDELGMLLRVRDGARAAQTVHPALAGLRAGQAARLRAAWAYREAGGDPVEELMVLLPRGPNAERQSPNAKEDAAPGTMQDRERQRENAGTDRLTH